MRKQPPSPVASEELSRADFLMATGGQAHDRESHHSWGAVCYWDVGRATYEEHQPDMARPRWFVSRKAAS